MFENLNLQDLDGEIWKNILDYKDDYQISSLGRVRSFKQNKINGKILSQIKDKDEYLYVNLCKNKKSKHRRIHILVYETFNNYKLKDDECIHHTDSDKENNNYTNIELSNKHDHNSIHKTGFKHSEKTKNKISIKLSGVNCPTHKLTEEQVIQIKLLLKEGILTQQEIADMFGVHITTIQRIKYGQTWSNIKV
jgi:cytolysin (calcineurin-like family phosphatase)